MVNFLMQCLVTLILALIAFAAPFLIAAGFRWLKAKLGNERYTSLMQNIKVAINAIEARMGAGGGANKKREVTLLIANKLKWASPTEVSLVIDAIVEEINRETKAKSIVIESLVPVVESLENVPISTLFTSKEVV